jgi:hypothetical protein
MRDARCHAHSKPCRKVATFNDHWNPRIVSTGTRVISPDGRMMTIATKGTDAGGRAFTNVEVFDKR